MLTKSQAKKGSSRNPGKHRNKNADLIDDVRASKHIQQTGVLVRDINTYLPFWEGFSVATTKPDGDAREINMTPHATRFPSCGGCQKPCSTTHEYCKRTVRDLPILGRAVRLSVLLRRHRSRHGGCVQGVGGEGPEQAVWPERNAVKRLCERAHPACKDARCSYESSYMQRA
ncbi:hypothetical protein AB7M23_004422 [Pseudomonas sp. HLS-6 TE3448]